MKPCEGPYEGSLAPLMVVEVGYTNYWTQSDFLCATLVAHSSVAFKPS